MKVAGLDFETYYDREYSLSKMTTEEYIHDDRFETIGVSITQFTLGEPAPPSVWFPQPEVEEALAVIDWKNTALLAQNTVFDGSILHWLYGHRPRFYFDTMSMARPFHNANTGVSLAKLVSHYGLGEKGKEVVSALGMRYAMFPAHQLHAYGGYCCNDTDLTVKLFDVLADKLPIEEIHLIDATLRMYIEPVLCLDRSLVERELALEEARVAALIERTNSDASVFRSDAKFAALLESLGVEPPTKLNPKGKRIYAFAKTDTDFTALQNHDDPVVAAAVDARLGARSSQRQTRARRFLGIHDRCGGRLPVALGYYNAHTGRYGAFDKQNLQNLPRAKRKDPDSGLLRKAIHAPAGHKLVVADLSQIEARLLVWQANQLDKVEAFAQKRDVYSEQAAVIYGRPVDRRANPDDYVPGFVGKCVTLGCLSPQTRVLSNSGWKPITAITMEDLLWDGETWVEHQGLVEKGEKEVVRAHGLEATSDHLVMTHRGWLPWSDLTDDASLFQSALSLVSLPSWRGSAVSLPPEKSNGRRQSDARVAARGSLFERISSGGQLRDAVTAVGNTLTRRAKSIGAMPRSFPTMRIAPAFSTGSRQFLGGAVRGRNVPAPNTMRSAGSRSTHLGMVEWNTGGGFWSTSYRLLAGTIQHLKSIASTMRGTTNPETFGSSAAAKTQAIGDMSAPCKSRSMTYDIAYAGPRNRFTVATDAGPVLVHNCGYGLGYPKFGKMIHTGMLGEKGILFDSVYVETLDVDVSEFRRRLKPNRMEQLEEIRPAALELDDWMQHAAVASNIINVYRNDNAEVVKYWDTCSDAITAMYYGTPMTFGGPTGDLLVVEKGAIVLPNGMRQQYEGLELDKEGQFSFLRRKTGRVQRTKIYGGALAENLTQALARIVIMDTMRTAARHRLRTALQVHDELVLVVPDRAVEDAYAALIDWMSTPPSWAPTLPLAAEGGYGICYGDIK